jgi:tetratricopeptide (TPR) repeat protein
MQDYVKAEQRANQEAKKYQSLVAYILNKNFPVQIFRNDDAHDIGTRLAAHVEVLGKYRPMSSQMAQVCTRTAVYLKDIGRSESALDLAELALQISEETDPQDSYERGSAMSVLGRVYEALGDAENAEKWAESEINRLSSREKFRDVDTPPEVGSSLINLARAKSQAEHHQDAVKLAQMSIIHGRLNPLTNDRKLSLRVENLAEIRSRQGKHYIAYLLGRRALKFDKDAGLDTSQPIHFAEHALQYAKYANEVGEVKEAIDYAKRARDILLEKYNNPDHPRIRKAEQLLENLGSL